MTLSEQQRFQEPVTNHIRKDYGLLREDWTVHETIEHLRTLNIGERIIYFYVSGENDRLVGVVPTRKLLMSAADQKLGEIMSRRVVAIPKTATVFDACEFFVLHKFFALPVVDEQRRLLGVVDINLVTEEVLEGTETPELQDVFEVLGFHMAAVRNAGPFKAVRFRFPWLVATILSGTVCAFITGEFEATLQRLLVLAFFLPLVFGLAESVSMQSMTLFIQSLRVNPPSRAWYFGAVRREATTATLLGLVCGLVVGLIVWAWHGQAGAAAAIGVSVLLSFETACFLGLSIPSLLHALKLDPKIAAGPVTLALTDIATLLFYFGVAAIVLR
ncbi:MAG: magnesium transporter [Chthoniobacteraceae bacterium]|nr:magnesium transporter [Chthoniobacteraceae bacterium]